MEPGDFIAGCLDVRQNRNLCLRAVLEFPDSLLLEDGSDIRPVQALLGHKDVNITMVYTHVLTRGGRGVKSPADRL